MSFDNSNVFGENNLAGEDLFEDRLFEDRLFEDRLLFRHYGNYRLFKMGEFLNNVLEKEELNTDVSKFLNACTWINLSLSTISYIDNVLDIAKSLASDNNNLNHLNVLCSCNLKAIKSSRSVLANLNGSSESMSLTLKLPSKEEYIVLLDSFTVLENSMNFEESVSNCVVGGSCYSKFFKLKELSTKVFMLNFDLCKDLKFILVNKHPIDLQHYGKLIDLVVDTTKDFLSKFIEFVESINLLVKGEAPKELVAIKMNTLTYLNYSKNLIDHFGYLVDLDGFIDRASVRCSESRRRNVINNKRIELTREEFTYSKI